MQGIEPGTLKEQYALPVANPSPQSEEFPKNTMIKTWGHSTTDPSPWLLNTVNQNFSTYMLIALSIFFTVT